MQKKSKQSSNSEPEFEPYLNKVNINNKNIKDIFEKVSNKKVFAREDLLQTQRRDWFSFILAGLVVISFSFILLGFSYVFIFESIDQNQSKIYIDFLDEIFNILAPILGFIFGTYFSFKRK